MSGYEEAVAVGCTGVTWDRCFLGAGACVSFGEWGVGSGLQGGVALWVRLLCDVWDVVWGSVATRLKGQCVGDVGVCRCSSCRVFRFSARMSWSICCAVGGSFGW